MDYALSTMWAINRFTNLKPFFEQGEKAGFTSFELNHGVTTEMLVGMEGRTIQSVHEPCPADISTAMLKKNDWLISSLNEENRKKGVASIIRSIDLAITVGARAVIVHPGRVDTAFDGEERMRELFNAGKRESREYAELLEKNAESRTRAAPANLAQTMKSLEELSRYAAERGVILGLENRYHYHEIPSPDELGELLKIGAPGSLGFWYDVGHAETLSRLGFFPHREWLERFADLIVGAHFHDLWGIEDHHRAGDGTFPWDSIIGCIPPSALRTCEFQNNCSFEDISLGLQFLRKLGV